MEYNVLGNTGLRISDLTLGTMSFGGPADEEASTKMFYRCLDEGINCFDCADVYNGGRSEEILGRLIEGRRHEVVITSKAYFPIGEGINDRGASRHHITLALENSLRRLATDYVDLYFIHRFDENTALRESLYTLERLTQQGKIRYWGVSNFAAWQTMKALGLARRERWAPPVCMQPMYNLVKRQAEVEILPMAASERVGVMAYSPLGAGLLTGKYGPERTPEQGRIRDNDMYRSRYGERWMFDVAGRFTEFAEARSTHPVSLAVSWVASHPAVTTAIIGGRNVEQLNDSLAAADIDMTPELRRDLSALSPAPPPATDRLEERKDR
jgi:aryl-alcohol dehydrogenase-like predicted oxidoreductase